MTDPNWPHLVAFEACVLAPTVLATVMFSAPTIVFLSASNPAGEPARKFQQVDGFQCCPPVRRHFPLSMLSYLPNSTDTIHDLVDAALSEIAVQHQTKYCLVVTIAAIDEERIS
jgi:hypothetical protein